jgi:hypothetical protein
LDGDASSTPVVFSTAISAGSLRRVLRSGPASDVYLMRRSRTSPSTIPPISVHRSARAPNAASGMHVCIWQVLLAGEPDAR